MEKLKQLLKRNKKIVIIASVISSLILVSILLISVLLPLNNKSLKIIQVILFPTNENITDYINKYPNQENNHQLNLNVEVEENNSETDFEQISLDDTSYPNEFIYTIKGKKGKTTHRYNVLSYSWLGIKSTTKFLKEKIESQPSSEKIYTGRKPLEDVQNIIKNNFEKANTLLKSEKSEDLNQYYLNTTDYVIDDNRKLENIQIKEIRINNEATQDDQGKLKTGSIILHLQNCKIDIEEDIYYDYEAKTWHFKSVNEFVQRLCLPQFIQSGDKFIGTCLDCTFFPVNKKYGLRNDYLPPVVVFELQNNALVHTRIHEDLKNMYQDAVNNGHSILINSAFRSYEVQENTFESWVQTEMNNGRDRATAETIANTYSARPGFSEHQLGTVVDIVTTQCSTFGHGCGPSEALWKWLRENGYKYGFALSYPQNKESLTGYVYEPWHWRWIGKDLAAEFKQVENTMTLQEFLFTKNQY